MTDEQLATEDVERLLDLTEDLRTLQTIVGYTNKAHGFREESDRVKASGDVEALRRLQGNALMLIVGEASEAHEQIRDGRAADETYYPTAGFEVVSGGETEWVDSQPIQGLHKPEGVPSEIADIVIRCLDFADNFGFDLGDIIAEKMAYNQTRPYKHGRTF
ncbi:MAG: hypothetical protein IJO71_09415 [Microbacterium sp.]|uniref:hypothetical protein n=1 Tax=Microbacterium sp. TaxID=51671 RepID=UPI0025CEA381|nr:hypothetical protein [Microbacterium sp.]MBQ9917399.1 hypothetical protein [Microbacterium sp.]